VAGRGVDDATQQPVAHGHVHDPARALDFISRVQMPVFAEQNDADFVRVHVERNAEHIAGKLTTSSKPTPGRPETLAMPVATLVIVPTSRGLSCGVNASRTWLISGKALSKTSEGSQVPYLLALCFGPWFSSGLASYASAVGLRRGPWLDLRFRLGPFRLLLRLQSRIAESLLRPCNSYSS
jgi:hypothetical protein